MNSMMSFNFNEKSELYSPSVIMNQIPLLSINSDMSTDFLSQMLSKNPKLVNIHDEQNETFLSYAIKRNNKDKINLILSSPLINLKYVDKNNNTYLHLGVIYQNIEVVKLLIEKGISINAQNKDGNTALHLAYYLNNIALINLLISFKADINIKNNEGFIPDEIIPTNDIDKIAGFDISMDLDSNIDDELQYNKLYRTIETSNPNRKYTIKSQNNIINNEKTKKKSQHNIINNDIERTKLNKINKNSLFYNTEKGKRKISIIAMKMGENDKFIRKESLCNPFLAFINSRKLSNILQTNNLLDNLPEKNSDEYSSFNDEGSSSSKKFRTRKISLKNNNINIDVNNKILYDFLSQINLQKHYNILYNGGFINLVKIIEDTKKGNYIKDEQLKKLGINKPGERAKILIKIEERANLFGFSISNSVYYFANNDIWLYQNNANLNKLFLWLKDINLETYYYNFVNNGYFSIDLLFVQMSSKNPLTNEILKNDISVDKLGYRIRILNKLIEDSQIYINKLKDKNLAYENESDRRCNCIIF